jgi:hypothetical protein
VRAGAVEEIFIEGGTTPLPKATDDRMISPDVANTAVPAGRDALKLGLGVALTDAGSVTFSDGSGIAPVDAASDSELSPPASSENWNAPKDPPSSSFSSSVVVLLELGEGATAEAVSDENAVGAGIEMLADAGGMTPDAPVERNTETAPDADTTAVPSEIDAVALTTGTSLAGADPEGKLTPNPAEADSTAVPPDTVKF